MEVLDPGHKYKLQSLDGETDVVITFVKRDNPPENYPGNKGSYPGTNIQEVLRCLIDRLQYLDRQRFNPINEQIINLLRLSIWLLEKRASENKGKCLLTNSLDLPELIPCQAKDGHFEGAEHFR